MKCEGRNVFTNEVIELEFDRTITHCDPLLAAADGADWIAPGFIDLQVNGFAGVDYNAPAASLDSIAGSIRALISTGVTRLFPTVITAAPDHILAALRKLATITRSQSSSSWQPIDDRRRAGYAASGGGSPRR